MASRSTLICLVFCCIALDAGLALPLSASGDVRHPGSPALNIRRASPLDLGLKHPVERLRGGAVAAIAEPAKPRGLHLGPLALVASFTICNLLNYVDRGLVNGVLPTLGKDFDVSKTHLGALTGAFMGGYCALCPIFAYLSNVFPPFLLMGLGLAVWEISAVMAATAPTFRWLLAARVLSGVGEASFQAIAPPFLDDAATDSNRGSLLAIFFCAIPVGTALGYVFGGYMEKLYTWRQGFLVLAALMAPLTLTCFFVNNQIKKPPAPASNSAPSAPKTGIADLFRNKVWLAATLGYSAWTFTIGAFAVWGPTLLHSVHGLSMEVADLHFGAITVAMGILGTACGGVLLDKITKKGATEPTLPPSKQGKKKEKEVTKKEDAGGGSGGIVTMSLVLCSALTALAMPFLFLAFSNAPLSVFYAGMVLGEFFLFTTTAPLNGVFLWCVSAEQRSMSLAVANLVIHLLGDVMSPVIAGWLWQELVWPLDQPVSVKAAVRVSVVAAAGRTLDKAIAALPKRKHVKLISKFALMEYKLGSAERGATLMERVVSSYPKRDDLWSVFIDMQLKAGNLDGARGLLARAVTLKLRARQAKFFFKRWLELEKTHGTAETVADVKDKVREANAS